MCLDIEERHLLRLGHGEEELATDKDFSRYGRVNFILALRMELLKEVERLQVSSGHPDSLLLLSIPSFSALSLCNIEKLGKGLKSDIDITDHCTVFAPGEPRSWWGCVVHMRDSRSLLPLPSDGTMGKILQ